MTNIDEYRKIQAAFWTLFKEFLEEAYRCRWSNTFWRTVIRKVDKAAAPYIDTLYYDFVVATFNLYLGELSRLDKEWSKEHPEEKA